VSENSIVNLLVIDSVDTITQSLRRGGYIVQSECSDQEAAIQNLISTKSLDLIVARQNGALPSIAWVRALLGEFEKDIPIIAIVDNDSRQGTFEMLQEGADNACDPEDQAHLLRIVRKELHYRQLLDQADSFAEKLAEAEARSRQLLDDSRDAIAYIHEGAHMYANPVYVDLFGYANAEDLQGVTLMDLVERNDRDRLKRFLRYSTKQGKGLEPIELTGVGSNGYEFPIAMSCTPTRIDDEPCLQIVVSEAGQGHQTISLGYHDPLTELYNRSFFIEQLNKRLSADGEVSGTVFYILLDAYRTVGQRFGLEACDLLVTDVAKKVTAAAGSNDIVARFADAVLTVYRPEASRQSALGFGRKLCTVIKENTSYLEQRLLTTTASIGACLMKSKNETAMQLLSNADRACESAHKKGGDQVAFYGEEEGGENGGQYDEDTADVIRESISAERMRLLYQPIASFESGSEERYEVLLEILDAKQQALDMDVIKPIARQSNLMQSLDRWTIITALSVLTERYQASRSLATLFVPVSESSCSDRSFISWLEQRLRDTGLSGNKLVLEVTEELAEQYFKELQSFREQLHKLGCGFSLLHFGGKTNSERILEFLKPDYVKLDIGFIENMLKTKDGSGREAIAALTERAMAQNTQVIAADINNAAQMASIFEFGIVLAQGHLVLEPGLEMGFNFSEFAA
jgi:diguanylate cyclase (GGDEF)-like protein/PAS domain S-box-containing protein